MVDNDPSKSMKAMARNLQISEQCIRPCMIEDTLGKRLFCLQQHSAPCHTFRKIQKWLGKQFLNFTTLDVWPPNSHNLKHMDFFVWSTVERDTNRAACSTKEQLITCIQASFTNLPRDAVKRTCQRFRGRIEAVVRAKGNFMV